MSPEDVEIHKTTAEFFLLLNSALEMQIGEQNGEYAPLFPTPEQAAEHPLYQQAFEGGEEAVKALARVIMMMSDLHIQIADIMDIDVFEYLDARNVGIMTIAERIQ